ncbi:TPA: hypothetical protein ACGOVU_002315 [Streptococcus suis]
MKDVQDLFKEYYDSNNLEKNSQYADFSKESIAAILLYLFPVWLRFLLTGTAGFIGNLVPDEITDQLLYFYQKGCKLKLRLDIALAIWYNKVAIELY